jgi:hypothetical protein
VIDSDVGFLTAQDEPGTEAGHRSCLWNGLMASTPGHPFLIRTIENVVNNIRNRFTSVDYDDMLCPNPALSVSHTADMVGDSYIVCVSKLLLLLSHALSCFVRYTH